MRPQPVIRSNIPFTQYQANPNINNLQPQPAFRSNIPLTQPQANPNMYNLRPLLVFRSNIPLIQQQANPNMSNLQLQPVFQSNIPLTQSQANPNVYNLQPRPAFQSNIPLIQQQANPNMSNLQLQPVFQSNIPLTQSQANPNVYNLQPRPAFQSNIPLIEQQANPNMYNLQPRPAFQSNIPLTQPQANPNVSNLHPEPDFSKKFFKINSSNDTASKQCGNQEPKSTISSLASSEDRYHTLVHKFTHNFHHSTELSSYVYLESQNKFIVCDKKNSVLHILFFDKTLGRIYPYESFEHLCLLKPKHLCAGNFDQIFVSEHSNGNKIVIFSLHFQNFEYHDEINLKQINIDQMKMDLTDNRNLLYISDMSANKVFVVNSKRKHNHKHEFNTDIDIFRPNYIEFDVNFIYITSYISYSEISEDVIESKYNSISVLNKTNYELVRIIHFDDWFMPIGLYIDKNRNIFTRATVFRSKNENINGQYLFIIASDGTLIRKIKFLDCPDHSCKYVYISDKFIFYLLNERSLTGFCLHSI